MGVDPFRPRHRGGASYRNTQLPSSSFMEIVKASGGLDKLHMAFYQQGDLGNDKVWDI